MCVNRFIARTGRLDQAGEKPETRATRIEKMLTLLGTTKTPKD